ncbi:hypothetical protein Ari01nite_95430 [Paractinoplanes rishiriensis]|uniref:Glycoside hydrolase family 65 central catalytic domain-containing protein n=1 Tax=Paractinoplanes rishiriensis TaxID=1050105 RepID=A0A919KBG4_9ACTN|nr:hypothetical protein Ari01nite_95430 [Actinoplanes rishiriensis]
MPRRNLIAAADAAARHPGSFRALGVRDEEISSWRSAAAAMNIPYDEELGVHPQARGFTLMKEWDFTTTAAEDYPLMLRVAYLELYRTPVVKQADLELAMHWCGDSFSTADKARNFAYYESRTVRDSSLSACSQAIMAAEVGHLDLLRRGLRVQVRIRATEATYSLRDGRDDAELQLWHHGEPLVVTTAGPVSRPIPAAVPKTADPVQPPGRAPARRPNLLT